jgi:DNA mismatch repair protein PMS2
MIERDLLVVEDVVGVLERELEEEVGRGNLDEDEHLRMEGAEGGNGRELDHGGSMANGVANVNVNGKVDREDGEEDGNDKNGKGKQTPPEKKGWFSWLW